MSDDRPKVPDENEQLQHGKLSANPADGAVRVAPLREIAPPRKIGEPCDVAAENALLAALLWAASNQPDVLRANAVIDLLPSGEPFYVRSNGQIFDAMLACLAKNEETGHTPVEHDPVAVATHAARMGNGRDATGVEALLKLQAAASTVSDVQARAYADSIRSSWAKRCAIRDLRNIATDALSPKVSDVEIFERAQKASIEIMERAATRATTVSIKQSAEQLFRDLAAPGGHATPTGIKDLDAALNGGLRAPETSILGARTSVGKAHPLDTKILTPHGWREIRHLAAGDAVIGRDGRTCLVTGVFDRGELDVFRVRMKDGGAVLCSGEHLWSTRTWLDLRAGRPSSVRTTLEIRDSLLHYQPQARLNHRIPYVGKVQFAPRTTGPLAPYLLGCLLGDGGLTTTCAMFTNADSDIVERVRAQLPPEDELVTASRATTTIQYRVKRRRKNHDRAETVKALDRLGLMGLGSGSKFIPDDYKFGSIECREEILRGLCDTDGCVAGAGDSCVEFLTISERLAKDVMFVVQSLGGRVSCALKKTSFTYKGERRFGADAYRLVLTFPHDDVLPFHCARKAVRYRPTERTRQSERSIESVEPAGRMACRCIGVDASDGLYVTEDFIVTHNSSLSIGIAEYMCVNDPLAGVLYVSMEMPHKSFTTKILASRTPGVTLAAIRRKVLNANQWKDLTDSVAAIKDLELHFTVSMTQTLASVFAAANERQRVLKKLGKRLVLVIIDHIGLVKPSNDLLKKATRQQQVAETSRGLRWIASEIGCHVMALAQIHRDAERQKASEGIPKLHHLREAGDIEQDADQIMILHRPRDPGTGLFVKDKPSALVLAKSRLDEETLGMLLDFQKGRYVNWADHQRSFFDEYGSKDDSSSNGSYGPRPSKSTPKTPPRPSTPPTPPPGFYDDDSDQPTNTTLPSAAVSIKPAQQIPLIDDPEPPPGSDND